MLKVIRFVLLICLVVIWIKAAVEAVLVMIRWTKQIITMVKARKEK